MEILTIAHFVCCGHLWFRSSKPETECKDDPILKEENPGAHVVVAMPYILVGILKSCKIGVYSFAREAICMVEAGTNSSQHILHPILT